MEAVEIALNPENLREKLNVKTEDPQALWDLLITTVTSTAPVIPAPVPEVAAPAPKEQTLEESNAKPERIKVVKEPVKQEIKKPEVKKVIKSKK